MLLNEAPTIRGQFYDRELSAAQVLLIFDPLIASNHNFKSSGLSSGDQLSVSKLRPAMIKGGVNLMAC